ncbi:MAG: Rqc2 family fibronectin-binding protein [Bilifractor sp.]|jgi:predicted ribosome quality control (RQC) complex YloA/Tae2 family protein
MAFDGITVAAVASELGRVLTGGKITRIIQPEKDELLLTVKSKGETHRLVMSANASLPLIYLTGQNLTAPDSAPNFCMLLRKHIGGGAISSITQPGLERIIRIEIRHRDELGDPAIRVLTIELMGKYSNIILLDSSDTIIDAIKRVPSHISSVREVLPGRAYFIPQTQQKQDPLTISEDDFIRTVCEKNLPVGKAIYTSLTGISPVFAEEICFRASISGTSAADELDELSAEHLARTFSLAMEEVRSGHFSPTIYKKEKIPFEFSALPLTQYDALNAVTYDSVSLMLRTYYEQREVQTRIRQKSSDLRKIVSTLTERTSKKLSLQEKQLRDTAGREKYRIYGELIHSFGYNLGENATVLETVNYYTGKPVRIPLDPAMTPAENAQRYFAKYTKMKRTAEDLETRILSTRAEKDHLESIGTSLDIAETEEDLGQIREELEQSGYVRARRGGGKKKKRSTPAEPLHFRSSDGHDIFVGKNNLQNEEVSFRIASGNDWWFHAKKMPGSHVIVKCAGDELPDSVFEEAGRLAAYYSSGRGAPKVEIDYTRRKNLKKPAGSKPGFVIYHTNYSLMAEPDITGIQAV